MKLSLEKSLKVFGIKKIPSYGDLKRLYRKLSFKRHPDQGGSHEKFCELADAFDCLIGYAEAGIDWVVEQDANKLKWRADFRARWKRAYNLSRSQKIDDGLHFSTCIERFRREYIYPPADWFTGALFGDKGIENEEIQQMYRAHLYRIAPNPRLKESFAKRYFELEFAVKWVFYLPGTVAELRAA